MLVQGAEASLGAMRDNPLNLLIFSDEWKKRGVQRRSLCLGNPHAQMRLEETRKTCWADLYGTKSDLSDSQRGCPNFRTNNERTCKVFTEKYWQLPALRETSDCDVEQS